MQAVYALARRLVNWVWGFPIAVYNILIATIGVTRYAVAHGATPAEPLVVLLASQSVGDGVRCAARRTCWRAVLSEHADGLAGVSGAAAAHGDVPAVHVARRARVVVFIIAIGGAARRSCSSGTTKTHRRDPAARATRRRLRRRRSRSFPTSRARRRPRRFAATRRSSTRSTSTRSASSSCRALAAPRSTRSRTCSTRRGVTAPC